MSSEIGEKCGVFGVYGKGLDVARLTFFGLYALQHRGQESSGIAVANNEKIMCHKNNGLVSQVFNEEIIKELGAGKPPSFISVGHNRYSTSGSVAAHENIQPIIVGGKKACHIKPAQDGCSEHTISEYDDSGKSQTVALAHNGNLPSTKLLEKFLKEKNVDLCRVGGDPCVEHDKTCIPPSDSAMITEALAFYLREGLDIEQAVEKVFPLMTGTFSILIMTKDKLIAIRDSYGIRPFSIGKLNGGFVFASETCALHPIGATYLRDVNPGEMVVVDEKGLRSKTLAKANQKFDIFEFVYFARPDSVLMGQSVYDVRKRSGIELAKEYKIDADIVIPVPETANPVAIGFSQASKIPFEMGIIKSRYIHRTFIEPEQHIREQGVKLKLSPLPSAIKGKRVIVMDDSIVRGTSSKQIVKMLFEAGAKEVHFMVSSPPVKFPDFYGIDTPKQKDLIGAMKSVEEIRKFLGATTLNYLSYEGLIRATGIPEDQFCTSCFTGAYPLDILEKKETVFYPKH